ncbi:hypothetical protein [Xenorhabdus cabanillasii]|uniref:Fels-2 prophage protein n=1 Tax=Xenorhabdus cabanillasii JM26 TaxID=1427517 RepID=W1J451_9GAMM|nr:hypothetical protein [Xenorhabdus cabanillasii]PHM75456.1 hypothetical protein Xcab_04069 [Xenorhabdus cabanillasii JM26]CDL84631.1 putative Fels-2 prophage protein [Xenorhabdus cabanillasii JM26]
MTNQPSREDIILDVNYSLYLEEMTGIFNQRCNQFCSFIQLFLGASVFASTQFGWLLGLIIAFISALQVSFKFGEKAGNAKAQVSRYRILLDDTRSLSDDDILRQMQSIEKSDTHVLSSLKNPARKRASIALKGYDFEPNRPLTKLEKISAVIGGGIPK